MGWGDYESTTVRALRSIDSAKYNKEFTQNMQSLNYATDFMADYMIVMQKGIDDANKDIIQKIQDFIEDLIIIFGGGDYGDSGFEWGDLGYIIQAIGALFGFGTSGPVDLFESAAHFLGNFLEPLGLFGDIINGFIKSIFEFFAGLLSNVPIVGTVLEEIVTNVADGINDTTSTANTAQSTATTANSAANAAVVTANAASSTASAAQTSASNAASVAAAAQETADIAYENAQYNKDEFAVSSAGVVLGKNEETLGILMTTPADRIRKITRVIYSFGSNTSTATIQLIRKTVGGTESVVLTTNISSGAIVYPDNTIDYETTDLDHYMCNVTTLAGTANTLHCCIESVILEAP